MTTPADSEVFVCDAVDGGYCDHHLNPRPDHSCVEDDGHDGAHECGCGHRWTDE